jgi:penicillin-binding protein 1A
VSFVSAKQQQTKTKKKKKGSSRILRKLVSIAGILFVVLLIGAILAGCSVALSAPSVTDLEWSSSTVIYDRTGEEVYRLHAGENRTPVKLDKIPKQVQEAFIAIEDPNFYSHHGLDFKGIARAAFYTGLKVLGLPGGRMEGASTITMQLAGNAFLDRQDLSLRRKAQEMWLAVQLERKYTKDEILEMYLNQIYYGHGAYGIEAAARTFFAKDVDQLTVAEGAQLAGMMNGPSIFDPYLDMNASVQRRNLVLQAMLKENDINQATYEKAKAEEPQLGSKQSDTTGNQAGSFTDYVINILQDAKPGLAARYGLKLGDVGSVAKAGLKVYTTVDPKLQDLAEKAVADQMADADKQYGTGGKKALPQAAMVVMDPKTGEVLAMVGGRDHEAMLQFNRATDALRQPGSSTKPILAYMPAIDAGLAPATILDDAPVMLTTDGKDVWPKDYEDKYMGLKPMRYGVEQSVNPMAVRAMQAGGGPSKGLEYAKKFGLSTIGPEDNNLALALGGITKGVSVLDETAAYAALANMGLKVDPVVITKIVDNDGNTVFEAQPHKTQVVKPSTAYLMIDMMKDVVKKGTAYGFTGGFKGWPAAGKTGTTEYNQDSWFVGFTPNLVATVWNGYDNQANHLPWTGAFVPVKTWNQFMTQAVTQKPADWPRPSDVVNVTVDRRTGMLPSALSTPDQLASDLFVKGTEPKTSGSILVKAKAVQVTLQTPDKKSAYTEWQLWQPGCTVAPMDRVFIKRPQPRVLHPTDPYNPKYIPADAKDELPTRSCTPGMPGQAGQPGQTAQPGQSGVGGGWLDNLVPSLPWMQPGQQNPGTTQPGTTQTQQPAQPGTGDGQPGSGKKSGWLQPDNPPAVGDAADTGWAG